jgi:predicted nucleotidyltransferase
MRHSASSPLAPVDLVSRKALKPHIGERILKEVIYI